MKMKLFASAAALSAVETALGGSVETPESSPVEIPESSPFEIPDDVVEVEDPCPVCPNGITAEGGESFVLLTNGDEEFTCGVVVNSGKMFSKDHPECFGLLSAQLFCCPDDMGVTIADNPCDVCPDGVSAPPDTPIPEMGGLMTCAGAQFAKSVDADSYDCQDIKLGWLVCCPEQVEAVPNPCPLCSDGVTVDEGTLVDEEMGITCGVLVVNAKLIEAGSHDCEFNLQAEALCCPATDAGTDGGEKCPYCPSGLAVDGATSIPGAPNGESCGDLVGFAAMFDDGSDECDQMLMAQPFCCPGSGEPSSDGSDETTGGDAADAAAANQTPSEAGAEETGGDAADAVDADKTPSEAGAEEPASPEEPAPPKEPAPAPSPEDDAPSSAYSALHLGGGTLLLISIVAYLL